MLRLLNWIRFNFVLFENEIITIIYKAQAHELKIFFLISTHFFLKPG